MSHSESPYIEERLVYPKPWLFSENLTRWNHCKNGKSKKINLKLDRILHNSCDQISNVPLHKLRIVEVLSVEKGTRKEFMQRFAVTQCLKCAGLLMAIPDASKTLIVSDVLVEGVHDENLSFGGKNWKEFELMFSPTHGK